MISVKLVHFYLIRLYILIDSIYFAMKKEVTHCWHVILWYLPCLDNQAVQTTGNKSHLFCQRQTYLWKNKGCFHQDAENRGFEYFLLMDFGLS